ncbi:hypothetical protein C7H09_12215 [Marinobacter fuscus]|uniref:Zinc resistance-associated protein n=1 Tax=Marinobacter fuscus TaxID=2109942 RepID=A0A2T1K7Q6_9GAMM|nr:hypothetical protein [Marinobacter fuscus]PSF06095.1 hypothetical protein C7H09_12215 [Marinobacter fuscus]
MKKTTSLIVAGVMTSAMLMASSTALADRHGKHHQGGKWDKQELCEQARDGKGPFNREERRAEMEKQRAEMADRLQLTAEQREIWADIHQERQARHQERMDKWQKKMQERCESRKNDKQK